MKQDQFRDYIGKRLVNAGIITEAQLEEALRIHNLKKGDKGLLGQTLVKMGFCTEEDIAKVVAERAGVPFVSLEGYPIDPAAMATISADAAKRYRALPLAFSDDKLVVAMERPTDILALDDLRILTGFDVRPVVVPDSELEEAIKRYSQASVGVEQSVEEEPQHLDTGVSPSEEPGDKPAVHLANLIITHAVNAGASDVHIELYEKALRVRFRLDGVLHDMMQPPRKIHASLVSRIKVMANMDIAEKRIPQDGRMTLKVEGRNIDIRVASLPASYGERLTLRLLDRSSRMITLEELGVASETLEKYKKTIQLPYGFILVTGPTGSGKSTTLYASLAAVDRSSKNVITIEDPVEYRIDRVNQVQINPKAGLTFASGLRSILRSDPDIIMVGEIRDRETAAIAIESALTGHLVFSSMHTNDAAGAISRLAEMEIEPYLTASSLACVLAQRLARVLCPHCREPYTITRQEAERIPDLPLEEKEEAITLFRANPRGCMRCSNTGFRGRVGIYELLLVTETIQKLTLERKSAREIKEAAVSEGMVTLRQDGMYKVRRGVTSLEEVMRVIV
ncbi:MAG: ATPase, T2SS/T4P/T4SS family [Bacillota bacterium]